MWINTASVSLSRSQSTQDLGYPHPIIDHSPDTTAVVSGTLIPDPFHATSATGLLFMDQGSVLYLIWHTATQAYEATKLIPDPNEQSAHYGVSRVLSHWDQGSVLEVVCIKLLLSSQHNQKLSLF